MNDTRFDLNLLRVFDALIQDRNLTRAGFRVGLSQPAMSHALAKLRKLTGDQLFVRVPTGMRPTEHASRIAPAVHEGLQLLGSALESEAAFEPSTAERNFQILLSDIGELVYLPRLICGLSALAPGVTIRVLNRPREAYADAFFSGDADLAIGFLPGLPEGFFQQRLFTDSYQCLVRADHPRIGKGLSLAQFVRESHVLVEPGGSGYVTAAHQTSTTTLIEHYLADQGLHRRVALRVPNFMAVAEVVQATDLIATIPSYLIRHGTRRPGVRMLPLPLKVPRFEVKQFWHERSHKDPGNRWLRGTILKMFRTQT